MNKKKWLATPYFIWSLAFILIPLGIIVYYGFTDKNGAFTLYNVMQITKPDNAKALGLALLLSIIATIICLILAYPLAMILSNMKMNQHRIYCTHFHIANVDELFTSNIGLANFIRKNRGD